MKKEFILLGILLLFTEISFSQQTVSEKWTFTKGIEVKGESATFLTDGLKSMMVRNTIGNSSFQFGMAEGNGHYHGLAKLGDIIFRGSSPGGKFLISNLYTENHINNTNKVIGIVHAGSNGLWVHNNSNVRIGGYKLEMPKERLVVEGNAVVTGALFASEVQVKAQTADFVFEPDYQLRSLDEVESFILDNKHLPDIPSAAHMEAKGVDLAEMNKLLLMKIEELTLYAIEKEKEVQGLRLELDNQGSRLKELDTLKYEIEVIKTLVQSRTISQ